MFGFPVRGTGSVHVSDGVWSYVGNRQTLGRFGLDMGRYGVRVGEQAALAVCAVG